MTDQIALPGIEPGSETPDQVTIFARVPALLRAQVEAATRPGETQSDTVRRLVAEGLDAERRAHETMAGPGTHRRNDKPTARRAAWEVTPRAGTQRAKALGHFRTAGARGLTPDEVCALMPEGAINGIARRVTDLLQGGLIEPATWHEPEPGRPYISAGVWRNRGTGPYEEPIDGPGSQITRPTRHGAKAGVYVITATGLQVLTDIDRKAEIA